MIIQKTSSVIGLENTSNWIVTDIENAIPLEKRHEEPTINMIIDDIRNSKFVDVYYSRDGLGDLIIVREKEIIQYGKPTILRESIKICNYSKIKDDSAIKPLNAKINAKLKSKFKKKVKKILPKVFAIKVCATALIGGFVLYNNYKLSSGTTIDIDTSISNDNDENVEDEDFEIETTTEAPETAINSFDILEKYCSIYGFSETIINEIYTNQFNCTLPNSEAEILKGVYEYYVDNLYCKLATNYNTHSEEEMENYIIGYAKVLGIDDDEMLYTMLAIHKLETGHGTSDYCRERNNLGGNIITNPYTNDDEFQYYPNAMVGAMDFCMDFYRIYKQTVPIEYQNNPNIVWDIENPKFSIEYFMNPIYCTENMPGSTQEWYELVHEIKNKIKEENLLQEVEQRLNQETETKNKHY